MKNRIAFILLLLIPLSLLAQGTEKALESLFSLINLITIIAAINPIVLIVYLITKKSWLLIPLAISTFIAITVGLLLIGFRDEEFALKGKLLLISGALSVMIALIRK